MTDSLAHMQIAVPAADSAAARPGTTVRTGYGLGLETIRTGTETAPAEAADSSRFTPADSALAAATPADSAVVLFPFAAGTTGPSVWRDTTSTAVFGTQAVTVETPRIPLAPPPSLTDNAVFQGFVLLLAATYAMLLYRNLGDIRTLLGRISRDTATGERLSEDPGGSGYSRFLHIATTIGMLFMGIAAVKCGDMLIPGQSMNAIPHGAVLLLSLLASLAWMGVAVYQAAVVRLAGAITLTQPFISQLVLLKRTYFSLSVIVTSPALLLFALCPRGTGGVWFCVVAIELIVVAALYLRETLNLFLSKKVSILHWILYLCTVEVFPISLLWLLATR